MKRLFCLLLLLLTCCMGAKAQPRARAGERIHAIKVGYLTDRLRLSPQQAAAFWPIYDRYEADVRNARRALRDKLRSGSPEDDDAANQLIDDRLDFQQQLLTINRKYKDQMLQVISPQQLATLYEAEHDFRRLLLQQLRNRRKR